MRLVKFKPGERIDGRRWVHFRRIARRIRKGHWKIFSWSFMIKGS
jgi:hypothetical protein